MEVIACIPELPHVRTADQAGDQAAPSACRAGVAAAAPRPGTAGQASAAVAGAVDGLEGGARRTERPRSARGRRTTAFPAPTVLVLAAVAAAVWAAAWRSEQLRAIEQRRPQRVALEPAASAAAARSVVP